MTQRNPFAVFGLSIITFGIYALYWAVKSKGEMVQRGAEIPTAWLIIVPIANIWWLWKFSEGVEKVTNGKMSGVIAFILLLVLDIIGMAVVQNEFNKVSGDNGGAPATVASPEQVAAEHAAGTTEEPTASEPPTQEPPAQQPPMVQ